jgi:hypothetical protein
MTKKSRILEPLADLPEDAEVEDAIERLYLLYKIEKGVEQADRGEKVTQEEARARMARWLP